MSAFVGQRPLSPSILALTTITEPTYADLFVATLPQSLTRSPEQWARAVVRAASAAGAQMVWRTVLGLRLADARSPEHVGGWAIADRGSTWIRLEAEGWLLTANIVVHVDDGELSVASFIRSRNPIAALVWPPVALAHRRALPSLLRQALLDEQRRP